MHAGGSGGWTASVFNVSVWLHTHGGGIVAELFAWRMSIPSRENEHGRPGRQTKVPEPRGLGRPPDCEHQSASD